MQFVKHLHLVEVHSHAVAARSTNILHLARRLSCAEHFFPGSQADAPSIVQQATLSDVCDRYRASYSKTPDVIRRE